MELSGLTHAEPATTTLIGESAKITGRLTVPSDGGITFSSLIFVPIASGAKITASGQLKSAGSVNGNAVVTLPSIAILSNYAGLPLKGAVTAKATVTGTTNAPVIGLNLSSNAVSIRDLTLKSLNVQANYNADRALRGAVTFLTDDEDAHQLEGQAKIKSTEIDMQALSGSIFGVTLAKGNKPQSVRLVSDNLTPFGKALTQALGPEAPGIRRGSLDMALAMGPGFEASLQGRKLFIDIGGGDLVRIGTASVSAKIGNADDGSLRASSDLTNVVWGDNRFSLVKLVASGTTTAPDFSLNAEEGARNGARVSIKGRIRPDDGKGRVLTLTQTEGRLGDASIDLIEPGACGGSGNQVQRDCECAFQ
jgi:hypothetical protein